MIRFTPRRLAAGLLSIVACTLVSCSLLQGALPKTLIDTLGQVTGLSTEVTDWSNSLSQVIDNTALGKLEGYAERAKGLGNQITDMRSNLSETFANPVGAIGDKLQSMAGIDIDKLRNLAPNARKEAVDGFTQSASDMGGLAQDLLKQFGG